MAALRKEDVEKLQSPAYTVPHQGGTDKPASLQGVFEASRGVAFWEPGNADEAAAAGRRLREEAARQQQVQHRQAAATETQREYSLLFSCSLRCLLHYPCSCAIFGVTGYIISC